MNRKAAIDKLLIVAEETANRGQFSLSNTINDLARRIALSSYKLSDRKVINDSVSRMAAELMFRDDFKTANNLKKIAEELNLDDTSEDITSEEIPEDLMTPDELEKSNQEYQDYLIKRFQDPDITDFEKSQITNKLSEMGVELPKEPSQNEEETDSTINFMDTLKDLGVELRIPKDLLN